MEKCEIEKIIIFGFLLRLFSHFDASTAASAPSAGAPSALSAEIVAGTSAGAQSSLSGPSKANVGHSKPTESMHPLGKPSCLAMLPWPSERSALFGAS